MVLGRRMFMTLSSSATLGIFAGFGKAAAAPLGDGKATPGLPRQPGIPEFPVHPQATDSMKMKDRVKAISNVFEVGEPKADYAYVEDLGDGRGLTVTSYGFCTCNDEVTRIIKLYDSLAPGNALGRFLLVLAPGDDALSSEKLAGFADAWSREAKASNLLPAVCEKFADQIYFDPAVRFARDAKIVTPVGLAILYDTLLQHGAGDDEDSLNAVYQRTVAQTAWPNRGTEQDFLHALLEVRRRVLANPHNSDTADVWRKSLPRVDALFGLLKNNPDLRPPVLVRNDEVSATIL